MSQITKKTNVLIIVVVLGILAIVIGNISDWSDISYLDSTVILEHVELEAVFLKNDNVIKIKPPLCFDKKNRKFIFNKKKSKNLIMGYSKVRSLSNNEKKSLNILCKRAALRYLVTRSYDYLNTPKNAIIKIKNPREYIQKLKVHNNFSNFKNYYN